MDTLLGANIYQWAFAWFVLLLGLCIIFIISTKKLRMLITTLDRYRTRFGFNTEIEFSEVKDVNKVAKREFYYNRRIEKEKQQEEKKKEPKGPIS